MVDGGAVIHNGNDVIGQVTVVVEIGMGLAVVGPGHGFADPHSVGIVGVRHRCCAVGHGCQLSAVLPSVGPRAVVGRIAGVIMLNGNTVVGHQQVAPVTVAVGVGDCIRRCAERPGGVGIFRPGGDVACVVVSPDMGEAAGLIVLPDQLVGAVVDVGRGVGAVADGQDVAVIIVGVGIGNIVVSVTLGTVGGNEGFATVDK